MKRSALTVLVACAALALSSPAHAAGGSGGGGGGTGGSGGGGGGGGGGTTTSVGSIRTVGGVATCDAGSFLGVTLNKGFAKRVEVVVDAAGTIRPDGTSTLGGTWELHLTNVTGGNELGGLATGIGNGVPSFRLTWLTSNVPVGTSVLSFVATRRDLGSSLTPDLPSTPVVETCATTLTVVGR